MCQVQVGIFAKLLTLFSEASIENSVSKRFHLFARVNISQPKQKLASHFK